MPCLLRLQAVFNADDEHLTAAGWDKRLVDALRIRRETVFQHVTGSVEAGRLNCCVLLSYAAPSFCTVPLTLLIAVYVTSFYEVCDPYLTVSFAILTTTAPRRESVATWRFWRYFRPWRGPSTS